MANKQALIDVRTIQLKVEMDQLVENIKELEIAIAELNELFKARTELLKEQFEEKKMGLEQKKEKQEQYLRELFEQVPQSETKTQRKVKLLNGDVVVKKAKLDLEKDIDKLLVWAQMNGRNDLINKKEVLSFKWADFKKDLVPTEDGIVYVETGELLDIEGLSTITKTEEMEIKY
ncbi:host-nuclease inhibitor Gam family protein [Cellulosilyticum sp. ST5]|uniref:host-nuclease inhibitor Gam family protein n=1 Tax=Cellulosilyticum sp. ST5 TaxID=3055805 RepID=UPI0039772F60